MMLNSSKNLTKYKQIKKKLEKCYPKGSAGYTGFTISVSMGGNKEPDFNRIELGGVACREGMSNEFLKLLIESVDNNIEFWEKCVERDIKELQQTLEL